MDEADQSCQSTVTMSVVNEPVNQNKAMGDDDDIGDVGSLSGSTGSDQN
jgi:hypothetical protein